MCAEKLSEARFQLSVDVATLCYKGVSTRTFGQRSGIGCVIRGGCVFHELDALHGYDKHPVRQVNLELLANQKLFQSGGRRQGVNFRRLESEALRRPIDEMNGDCG